MSQFFTDADYLKFLQRMRGRGVKDQQIEETRGAMRVLHVCLQRWVSPAWRYYFDHVGFRAGDTIPYRESLALGENASLGDGSVLHAMRSADAEA